MVSFNLIIGAVEPHHLSQCLDPTNYLDGVFFHPELPVNMNKQADLPAYLKQLALERIGNILIDAVQVYTDGSRDNYYTSGSGIYIKSQDHILRIQTVAWFFAVIKHQNKTTWITPPEHYWYQCSRPGGSLVHGFTRQDQTLLARFRRGHIKTMKFSEGCKSFEMCTNCSSESATPAHILECLGLTKQDLAEIPCWCWAL
ncbi:uncharacterized protein TNCV_2290321 [Trichonephila clavipes]|uniref:Uncharacterized protein n=1 Tax=Trichonephila clavipes TaxID=2585209 RepID=A0A8X6RJI9_TRICX|nr:uncharacterized protein TNCV_2290321 [Trichonephila clavipes]